MVYSPHGEWNKELVGTGWIRRSTDLRPPRRLPSLWPLVTVLVAIVIAFFVTKAIAASSDALTEANAACALGMPALPGDTNNNETSGQGLAAFRAAEKHSAKAFADDDRWRILDLGFRILVHAQAAEIAVTGPNFRGNDFLSQPNDYISLPISKKEQLGRIATQTNFGGGEEGVMQQCAIVSVEYYKRTHHWPKWVQ